MSAPGGSAVPGPAEPNKQVLAQLQALSTRIAVINEIGVAINRSLNIDEILRVMGQQVKWLIDFDYCWISLKQNSQETHRVVASSRGVDIDPATLVPEDVAARAFRSRQPQLIRQRADLKFQVMLVLPLEVDRQAIGIIGFGANRLDSYTYDDIRIAYMLALQVAAALRTAQQFATINELNQRLDEANQRSESLLQNVLPRHVVDELRDNGRVAPSLFKAATVMFIDFVGFSQYTASMDPVELLQELDTCFSLFDAIIERYGLEKLKTIGDSYMCVSGVPLAMPNHAMAAVIAAIHIVAAMEARKRNKEQRGQAYWSIRIGIHSGPLVAGVVGQRKFSYDVWGDTVNLAARLEQASAPGQINISRATHEAIAGQIPCVSRGTLIVKHGVELEMFFIDLASVERAITALARPTGQGATLTNM